MHLSVNWHFHLISTSEIVNINLVTLILEKIGQCEVTLWDLLPIKKNNTHFEDLDMGDFKKNEDFVWHRGWNFKLDKLT
jgi:hypothetical protein